MGGAVVDCGNFNYLKDEKFPSLSQPDTSYNNNRFSRNLWRLWFCDESKSRYT